MQGADHRRDQAGHNHGFQKNRKALLIAIAVTGTIMVVEVGGGLLANSLALLSDAGHMLTDVLALVLSLLALQLAARPPSATRTYGFYRVEILAALANGITLVLICLWIFYEAYRRLSTAAPVDGLTMLVVAAVGLMANGIAAWVLRPASRESLNIRGAYLHVLGDLLSSVGVLIGGAAIYFTGRHWVDPVLSVGICLLILRGASLLVRESLNILLEAVPRHVDLAEVERSFRSLPGVRNLHHVHLWTISSGLYALSAHVLIENVRMSEAGRIIEEINRLLRTKFNISHTTLQLECENCTDGFSCVLERTCGTENPPPERGRE
jgi:cobalt-zinc-cadmium efflux system protein